MRQLTAFLCVVFLSMSVVSTLPENRISKMPEGVFKKTRSGKIVQYNNNGKKIGEYKISNGRYVKTK